MFGSASRHDKVFYEAFSHDAHEVAEAARMVEKWLASEQGGDELQKRVAGMREAAAKVLHDGMCELRKTWITPFDPQDIRALLLALDGVMEMVNATAQRAVLFGLCDGHGDGAEEAARKLAGILARCCGALEEAFKVLPHKKSEAAVREQCEAVRGLEKEADVVYRDALAALYNGKVPGHDGNGSRNGEQAVEHLLSVIKWREVYDTLEQATDRCAQLALQLEAVVEAHG
jgi:uncharacterized protein